MRIRFSYSWFVMAFLMFSSCEIFDQEVYKEQLVAKPITISKDAFKTSAKSEVPRPVTNSGKIYTYGDYILVNELYIGIHVIDKTDPSNPEKIRFINIPGNVDMSIKNNYLFADSLSDLVVLDISELSNIRPVARLENVLQRFTPWPLEADIVDSSSINYDEELIVGWEYETELRLVETTSNSFWRTDDMVILATSDTAG